MAFFLTLLFTLSSAETSLKDGETIIVNSNSLLGTEESYKFSVGSVNSSDLTMSLTSFSDFSDPDMFVKLGSPATFTDYDYESLTWGSGSIVIPASELNANSDYYILVICYTYCKFGLTVTYTQEVALTDGMPLSGQLIEGHEAVYQFVAGGAEGNMSIVVSNIKGMIDMYVVVGADKELIADASEKIEETWDGNLVFKWSKFDQGTLFKVGVMAEQNSSYTILASAAKSQATMIQAGVPISGEVATSTFNFYVISVLSENDTLSISLTMLTGDGDIYVKASSLPSLKTYDFASMHNGNENLLITSVDRQRLNQTTGDYFIGIYGYMHSVYTLTVTTSNSSFIELTSGIPQSGSVIQNSVSYFYIPYPTESTNITISLTVTSGNPDLYTKSCSQDLKSCLFTDSELENPVSIYSSQHLAGSESIDIPHTVQSCQNGKVQLCNYVIGVYGVADYSIYTIVVTTNSSDEILLQDGKPLQVTAEELVEKFFKFHVFNETVNEVVFMLTPIYGDTILFGSFNEDVNSSFQKSTEGIGEEVDQIVWVKGVDSDSLKGVYHLATLDLMASSYSIVAKTSSPGWNSTIQIYPGHPQKDTIYNFDGRDYRIYTFPIHYTEETKQKITISLTSITGKYVLYASNKLSNLDWDNQIFYYNWVSYGNYRKDHYYTITILPSDPYYLLDSTYLILVYGASFLPDKSATYTLSYSVGDGCIALSEDIPFTGVVESNEYVYFTFPIHYSHEDLTLSLTSLSGDPDLYLSVNQSNPFPTSVSYDFKSAAFGSEKITLNWENGLKSACPGLPEVYSFGSQTQCQLYIAVFGYDTATFVIRVHPSQGVPIALAMGTLVVGNVSKAEYGFYYAYAEIGVGVTIAVQFDQGEVGLFVDIFDKANVSGSPSEWERPSTNKYDAASDTTTVSDQVELSSQDLSAKCPSGTCLIVAAVYCYSEQCTFYVQFSQKNQTQTLVDNMPTYGTSAQEYVYYSYYSNRDFDNFLIQVTPINSGNPELFVCKGQDVYPTDLNANWSSTSWGGNSILITKDDPIFSGGSMKGMYTIGVKDFWETSSFTIIVNNNPKAITKLQSGIPQYGTLAPTSFNYYYLKNYINEDIIINLTPTKGSGTLYVKTLFDWEDDMYLSLPSDTDFIWSSATSPNKYTINITVSDPKFCTYCDFLIAIKSENSQMTYSITAKNDLQTTLIQDGVPVRATTSPNHWTVFTFEVLQYTDFYVTLTSYSGRPNLYISNSKNLTWESYIWSKYYVRGTMNLKVSKNDTSFILGTYYIAVESNSDPATYSIVAHTSGNYITLVDGWPILYSLPANKSEGVYFRLSATSNFLSFTLKSFASYCPTMYIKLQLSNETSTMPSEHSYTYKYSNNSCNLKRTHNGQYISYLSIDEETLGNYSSYLFGVFSEKAIEFELEVSGKTAISVMSLGEATYGVVNSESSRRYEFITSEKGQLDVYVVPCTGSLSLEISSNWTIITQDIPDVVVNRMTEGTLAGSIHNADGIYYATISKLKDSKQVANFVLFSQFTKSGEKPKTPFRAGDNGLVHWKDKMHDRVIEVSWTGLVNDEELAVNETVSYDVYFTVENEDTMLTSCSILYNYYVDDDLFMLIGSSENGTSVEVTLPKNKGFINVLATLHQGTQSAIYEIVYDPIEVIIGIGGNSRANLWLYLFSSVVLILACATAFYFYRKKRAAENILNFEMNDVRNVASAPKPEIAKRANPYSEL